MKRKTSYIYIIMYLIGLVVILVSILLTKKKSNIIPLSTFEVAYFNDILEKINRKEEDILFTYFDYTCETCRDKIEKFRLLKGEKKLLIFISANDSLKSSEYLAYNLKKEYPYYYFYDKNYLIRDSLKITHVPIINTIDLKNKTKANFNSF